MTTIRYFIPEDGDNETHPNVFLAPKSSHHGAPPLLGQVKEAFPLPGRYHFRFKSPLVPGGDREKGGLAVWMDCMDDNEPVGIWRNSIVAKVTRISIEDDEYDTDEEFEMHRSNSASNSAPSRPAAAAAANAQAARPNPAPSQSNHSDPSLDLFDAPSSAPPSAPHSTASTSTGNLLDVEAPSSAQPAAAAGGGEPSLLDMSGPAYGHSTTSPSSAHNDFMGMTAGAPAPHSGGMPAYGQQQQQPPPPQQQQQQQQRVPSHHQSMPPQMAPQMAQQQQQQQQQRAPPHRSASQGSGAGNNAFDSFNQQHNQQQGPFGGLNWS